MEELYRRYITSRVVRIPNERLKVEASLTDGFFEGHLELEVDEGERRILAATGAFTRTPHRQFCYQTDHLPERLVGLQTIIGIGQAVRAAVGGPTGCRRWEDLALAAVQAVLQCGPSLAGHLGTVKEFHDNVRVNMIKNCAAYAKLFSYDKGEWRHPLVKRPLDAELFRRFVCTSVRQIDDQKLFVDCSNHDSYHEVGMDMDVELPGHRITRVRGRFPRGPVGPLCSDTTRALQRLEGAVAWPDQVKTLRKLAGGVEGCVRWEELSLEAVRAVEQAHYILMRREYAHDPQEWRSRLFAGYKGTCLAYSELAADSEWNPEAARASAD